MIVFCFFSPVESLCCVVLYSTPGEGKRKRPVHWNWRRKSSSEEDDGAAGLGIFLFSAFSIYKKKITIRFILFLYILDIYCIHIYIYFCVCCPSMVKGGWGGGNKKLQTKKKGHGFGPIWAQTVAVKKTFSQLIWLDCYLCYLAAANSRRRRPEKSFTSLLSQKKKSHNKKNKPLFKKKGKRKKRIHTVAILALFSFSRFSVAFHVVQKGGKKKGGVERISSELKRCAHSRWEPHDLVVQLHTNHWPLDLCTNHSVALMMDDASSRLFHCCCCCCYSFALFFYFNPPSSHKSWDEEE